MILCALPLDLGPDDKVTSERVHHLNGRSIKFGEVQFGNHFIRRADGTVTTRHVENPIRNLQQRVNIMCHQQNGRAAKSGRPCQSAQLHPADKTNPNSQAAHPGSVNADR